MIGEFERFFDHASAGVANAFAHSRRVFFLGPCGAEVDAVCQEGTLGQAVLVFLLLMPVRTVCLG